MKFRISRLDWLVIGALAAMLVFLPVPVRAQTITVNGSACATASVLVSSAGMVAVLPVACSGNGNPCASAMVTFSANAISILAPPACLSAPAVPPPAPLQNVTVNGNICNSATVIHSANGIVIDAPPACLAAAPIVPAITNISLASAYAGQSLTLTGTDFAAGATVTVGGVAAIVTGSAGSSSLTITIPVTALGAQPVVVTALGQPSVAATLGIVAVPMPVVLQSVRSTKDHGAAVTFDIPIDTTQAIGGAVSIESRSIGNGHVIVFQFDGAITTAGTVTAVDSIATPVSVLVQPTGNLIAVKLASLPDNRRVTISLTGINGISSASASMGFLLGDVNQSSAINATDVSAVKAFSGQVPDATNFRYDVNASGTINTADIAAIKARLGGALVP